MKTISTWLLGGALAASLTWNWTLAARGASRMDDASALDPASALDCAGAKDCASASACSAQSCALQLDDVALAPEKKVALETLCARSCAESDRLEQRADELQRELLASLSAETVDEAAATALVDGISELRRRSLAACVQGILGVRSVLDGAEVRALIERCEEAGLR